MFKRRLVNSSYGGLGVIQCIGDLVRYADGRIRKYTVYLHMMSLDPMNLTFLLDDFDSKWNDVKPRYEDLLAKRGMSVLDIRMSIISQLSVYAWIIYGAVEVWRYFPDVRKGQLESEQEIQTYQWWARVGAVIHLILSSGIFLMENCSVPGSITDKPIFLSDVGFTVSPMMLTLAD